jgi:AraC family transcriptional regulator
MTVFGPERFENGRPMLLGGLRQRHDFAAVGEGIVDQWRQFLTQDDVPGRVGKNLYGVMCGADGSGLEYMCGAEVESLAALPEDLGRMRVPAQRYAVFAHRGHASALHFTWRQILVWLPRSEYESAHKPDFEVYGPRIDPLAAVGGIEVWVGVVPRGSRDG